MIEKRLSYRTGEPILTVRITGSHDVYRFAWHLLRGQCEFSAVGHKVIATMRRKAGKERWVAMMDYMHGSGRMRP